MMITRMVEGKDWMDKSMIIAATVLIDKLSLERRCFYADQNHWKSSVS